MISRLVIILNTAWILYKDFYAVFLDNNDRLKVLFFFSKMLFYPNTEYSTGTECQIHLNDHSSFIWKDLTNRQPFLFQCGSYDTYLVWWLIFVSLTGFRVTWETALVYDGISREAQPKGADAPWMDAPISQAGGLDWRRDQKGAGTSQEQKSHFLAF